MPHFTAESTDMVERVMRRHAQATLGPDLVLLGERQGTRLSFTLLGPGDQELASWMSTVPAEVENAWVYRDRHTAYVVAGWMKIALPHAEADVRKFAAALELRYEPLPELIG